MARKCWKNSTQWRIIPIMKALLCTALCAVAFSAVEAATAYEALRVVGTERGEDLLDRIIQVRGMRGLPQPKAWKIVVLDSKAQGGAREFDVQGTAITGERPRARTVEGPPLNMNELNLDSDGAHTMAEREAKKAGFAYDHVSYTLQSGTDGRAPVWELHLVDEQNSRSALLTMAADSGKLLSVDGLDKGSAQPIANRPPRPGDVPPGEEGEFLVEERPIEERRIQPEGPKAPFPVRVGRFFDRAGRHIGGAFKRFGDTVDRAFDAPPPRQVKRTTTPSRQYRDQNGTEYYRPRD